MDWFGDLFASVSTWFSNITAYLLTLVQALYAALLYVWQVIQALLQWLADAFKKALQWLQHLWENGVKNIFSRLLSLYQKVHAWLESKLRPIIDFLKKVRAWYDRFYRQHILPMINLIQRIRRYLLILRLLHVKFATTLDNYLLRYEQMLNKVFLTVRGGLNQVIDWLNLATNPIGLGRLVLVSVATRRTSAAIVRAVTGLPIGHFFPFNGKGSFAFERRPMTASDYTDPARNPPPSVILAPLLDFMSYAELDSDQVVTDQDIDASESLPWGAQFISNYMATTDAFDGLDYDGLSLRQALEASSGNIYNAAAGGATYAAKLLQNGF